MPRSFDAWEEGLESSEACVPACTPFHSLCVIKIEEGESSTPRLAQDAAAVRTSLPQ